MAFPGRSIDLITRVKAGDIEAAFLLCQRRTPRSVKHLVTLVQPAGPVTIRTFDTCCDGYAAWREHGRAAA